MYMNLCLYMHIYIYIYIYIYIWIIDFHKHITLFNSWCTQGDAYMLQYACMYTDMLLSTLFYLHVGTRTHVHICV